MYKRFCIKCGKELHDTNSFLCDNCLEPQVINKQRKIKQCSLCGRIMYKNKEFEDFTSFLQYLSKEFSGKIESINSDTVIIKKDKEKISIKIVYSEYLCKKCKKYSNPRSFNYKVQLRGDESKIISTANILVKSIPPVNIKSLPEGVDLFFKINNFEAKKLLKILRNLGCSIKITRKLITYDKLSSKKIYKVTISARF